MLTQAIDAWAALFANHSALRTAVAFLHVAGLVVGGGLAIATDRAILRTVRHRAPLARPTTTERDAVPSGLDPPHAMIIGGLVALLVSGILLLAADVDTYLVSVVFWVKMALFVLLLGNGLVLMRQERRARAGDAVAWTRLRYSCTTSLALWALTTLAGATLPNIG